MEHESGQGAGQDTDAEFWDERYAGHDQLFSGNPNGVLVDEISDLPPGQALDVGCGEGADAIWLARNGWQVTAVDISGVALKRAAAAGKDVNGRVTWSKGDLTRLPPPERAFDLVSIQYFPLFRARGIASLRSLLAAVAPGGTLLLASHALPEPDSAHHANFDPNDYYLPEDFVRELDNDWVVLVDETRPRSVPAPEGSGHTHDVVLRAERLR